MTLGGDAIRAYTPISERRMKGKFQVVQLTISSENSLTTIVAGQAVLSMG